jgi:hypothetical protein
VTIHNDIASLMNARGFRSITVTLLLLATSIAIVAAASATSSNSNPMRFGAKLATVER